MQTHADLPRPMQTCPCNPCVHILSLGIDRGLAPPRLREMCKGCAGFLKNLGGKEDVKDVRDLDRNRTFLYDTASYGSNNLSQL